MELCANTSALNSYMRKIDRDEIRAALIESRTNDLMVTDYPADTSMIMEALGESSESLAEAIHKHIGFAESAESFAVRAQHNELIGWLVVDHIKRYRTDLAKSEAERMTDAADCHHCMDVGCKHCAEDEK